MHDNIAGELANSEVRSSVFGLGSSIVEAIDPEQLDKTKIEVQSPRT